MEGVAKPAYFKYLEAHCLARRLYSRNESNLLRKRTITVYIAKSRRLKRISYVSSWVRLYRQSGAKIQDFGGQNSWNQSNYMRKWTDLHDFWSVDVGSDRHRHRVLAVAQNFSGRRSHYHPYLLRKQTDLHDFWGIGFHGVMRILLCIWICFMGRS